MSEPWVKSPTETEDFGFNWASWLPAGQTIASSTWDAPVGITIGSPTNTTTATAARFTSGTDGEDYLISNTITTSNGQTQTRTNILQIRAASSDLTEGELVTIAEIVQESYASVQTWAADLNPNQIASIRVDLATWADIRDSHVKLTKDVDFDNERKREAIRQRVRKALGLSLVSSEISGYSGSVAVTPLF